MATRLRAPRLGAVRSGFRRGKPPAQAPEPPSATRSAEAPAPAVEIAPDDPIIAYFESADGPVDLDSLELESAAVADLKAAGVKLAVPLATHGALIGVINLGPRLSEQEYTADDRGLLDKLAAQAAPAIRIGQLVRQQEAEIRSRERIEQELRVAQVIQQNFLPKELPELAGWQVAAYYRPAREVGGDFYDFIDLPGDRLGVVIGDVTDKGVPAAMVMAATRSVLRASAQRIGAPGEVLARVNELLCPDMPEKMFVTCLYAVLERPTGRLRYANAGHSVPYARTREGVSELRATGMPLGLMPGMAYEEKEGALGPGESLLLHSDGLAEAHDPEREMFGFPRMVALIGQWEGGAALIDGLLAELDRFTGPGWEQEDDITLVTVQRSVGARNAKNGVAPVQETSRPEPEMPAVNEDEVAGSGGQVPASKPATERAAPGRDMLSLAEFAIPSAPGNERIAITRVAEAVAPLSLSKRRLERLKTAVGEATMNAMEHGNGYRPELPVAIRILASRARLCVHVTDRGGGGPIPKAKTPDLEAKLAGRERPRGWGLFLIERMVDEVEVTRDEHHHTVELRLDLGEDGDGNE